MKSGRSKIEAILKRRLPSDPDAAEELIGRLQHIKPRAYFSKPEFLKMCCWKSPRPRRLFESNSSVDVRRASIKLFRTSCEKERVNLLTSLKGVGIPTASAILTLTDPRDYGVIDIRVWQVLYRHGLVTTKASGAGFTPDDWVVFLDWLRHWARRFDVKARDVERVLFDYHKEHQSGTLY